MIILRKNNDLGLWFEYPESYGVAFRIRKVTAEKFKELQRPFAKTTVRGRRTETQYDEDSVQEAVIDYIIQDWEGILDENHDRLLVTLENKLKIMNDLELAQFVWDCSKKVEEISREELEQEKKE